MLGRGHRARAGRHAATRMRRPTADPRPPGTGDCCSPRAAPHCRSRGVLSLRHTRQVSVEQRERVYFEDKWSEGTLASGAAHTAYPAALGRRPRRRRCTRTRPSIWAAKRSARGYQARGGQDSGRALLRGHTQASQNTLAQQVGGAGNLNGSAGGSGCIGDLDSGRVLGYSSVIQVRPWTTWRRF